MYPKINKYLIFFFTKKPNFQYNMGNELLDFSSNYAYKIMFDVI